MPLYLPLDTSCSLPVTRFLSIFFMQDSLSALMYSDCVKFFFQWQPIYNLSTMVSLLSVLRGCDENKSTRWESCSSKKSFSRLPSEVVLSFLFLPWSRMELFQQCKIKSYV